MLTTDRVAGAVLALLALVVVWESRKLPLGSLSNPGPAYMPVVLATLLLACGVATVLFALALALGSFLLFDTLLRVVLPRGPLGL